MATATWEQLTLAARRTVYANSLPANDELPNDITPESLEDGWTAQQPYAHVPSAVALDCILCGEDLDQRHFLGHQCPVLHALGEPWTTTT